MAFCTGCGADVTGKSFCIQCGKPVAAGASSAAVVAAPSVSTTPKKISPVIWILVGIFGLFVVLGIALTAGAAFVAHKVKQNPALAIAKLATVGNPDLEAVAADEGANTVTFKDKRTGETVTMNFDDVKKGKIVFKSNGKEATIQAHGEGQNGTLEINSPDGTVKIGAGAGGKPPSWAPVYPGAAPQTTFSLQGGDGASGSFQFTTKDSAKTVLSFYEKVLKENGFGITANFTGNTDTATGGMMTAEDKATKRTVVVTVGTENAETTVNILFAAKK